MKFTIRIFAMCFALSALGAESALAAACNATSLVRCLDSACVADAVMEPGARCAQCGSASAADAINKKSTYQFGGSLKPQAPGQNSATTLDLRGAPADPVARYSWAATECLQKVRNCTAEDVAKNYDKLIEQSCRAVLTGNDLTAALAASKQTKSETLCVADIDRCVTAGGGCGADWAGCAADADFDRVFSACVISAGCGHLGNIAQVKANAKTPRDNYFSSRDRNIETLAAAYARNRETRLSQTRAACADGTAKQACAATACANLPNGCADNRAEQQLALNLCKYVELACDRVK